MGRSISIAAGGRVREDADGAGRVGGWGDAQQLPAYRAEVRVEGYPLPSMTGFLTYKDDMEVTLRDEASGDPLKEHPYTLCLANGEIRSGKTDGSGKIKEKDVPPGSWTLL